NTRPDYKQAREWEEGRIKDISIPPIYLHQPTFAGINGTINGNINNGTFTGHSEIIISKRNLKEDDYVQNQMKRTRMSREKTPKNQICPPSLPVNEHVICELRELLARQIIDMTDVSMNQNLRSRLNEGQQFWLDKILEKQTWDQTDEFKDFCSQFTEDNCSRIDISTLNASRCAGLELMGDNFGFSIIKVILLLISFHLIQVIGIAEFSRGIKSPDTNDVDDK
ncbi:14077_t:CDS:2, partial [Dentiscutata erythropus]